MKWLYRNKEVIELPADAIGFVYIIHYTDGTRYIGKKLAKTIKKLPPTKDMRRNSYRKKEIETNWRKYAGSSKRCSTVTIKNKIILEWCSSKKSMGYLEIKYLFEHNVLEDEMFLNDNIAGRYFRGENLGGLNI